MTHSRWAKQYRAHFADFQVVIIFRSRNRSNSLRPDISCSVHASHLQTIAVTGVPYTATLHQLIGNNVCFQCMNVEYRAGSQPPFGEARRSNLSRHSWPVGAGSLWWTGKRTGRSPANQQPRLSRKQGTCSSVFLFRVATIRHGPGVSSSSPVPPLLSYVGIQLRSYSQQKVPVTIDLDTFKPLARTQTCFLTSGRSYNNVRVSLSATTSPSRPWT